MTRNTIRLHMQKRTLLGMVDTCTIRRRTGTVFNQDTGEPTPTYLTPDPYTGRCRVQQVMAQSQQNDAGQDYQLQLRLELQVPMTVVGIEVGDEVTITASVDPDLTDRTFRVRDLMHKTDASARRIGLTERTD